MDSSICLEQGPLNASTIAHVFSFLDTTDKQNVAQVCRCWKNIVYYVSGLWKEATVVLPFNPPKILILSLKKRKMTRVICSRSTREELSFLFANIPGLTYLAIYNSRQVSNEFLIEELPCLSRLEHLHIRGCNEVHLESLYFDASFASLLKQLKSLEIPEDISPNNFQELVSKMKNLEEVNLERCNWLKEESLATLSCTCPNVRELTFGWRRLFTEEGVKFAATKLKNLRSLDLTCNFYASEDMIRLIADNFPDLESLFFLNIPYTSYNTVAYVAERLKKLKHLSFGGMKTQSLDDEDDEEEELNEQLEEMFEVLSKLERIESLKFYLSNVSGSNILSLVKNMPNMKNIIVTFLGKITKIQAIEIGKLLPNLESIKIGIDKKCHGIASLCSQLKNLTDLNLDDCKIIDKDLHEMLPGLGNLKSLILSRNPRITNCGVKEIANNLKSLTSLYLSGKIDDAGVAVLAEGLPRLKSLNLSKCNKVSSEGAIIIGKHLKSLQELRIRKTKICDVGFSFICHNLPQLKTLDAALCPLTNNGIIDGAVSLGNLVTLEIGSPRITNDSIKKSVQFLKALTCMKFVGSRFISKSAVLCMLKDLPNLTYLVFTGCHRICLQEFDIDMLCKTYFVHLEVIGDLDDDLD